MSEPTDSLGRETSSEQAPQTVDDFAAEQGNLTDEDQADGQDVEQGEQAEQPE